MEEEIERIIIAEEGSKANLKTINKRHKQFT